VYKDGVDLHPDEFYQMLEGGGIFPSTSPPGKGEFLEVYRRLVATGDVVSIHVSAKQSLTSAHAAEAAADGANEFAQLRTEADGIGVPEIRIIDSKSNSVGLGLLVVFASRMIERGLGMVEIVARLEDIRERLQFLFLVDTLEFLRKGGRIGQAQALIGTLLGIKPILGMVDGEVVPVDKVRGGRRAQPRLMEILRERVDTSRPVFVATAHASAPKWGERLKDVLADTFDIVELLEGEIGPVVGAHAGPGAVGCIVFQPNEEELELLQMRD
jgi:DegV family protein with EDD domain